MSRIRSQSTEHNVSGATVSITYETGKPPSTATVPFTAGAPNVSTELIRDVVTPFYKRRQRKGEIIVNDLLTIKSSISSSGDQSYILMTERRPNGSSPFTYYSHSVTTTSNFTARQRYPWTSTADVWLSNNATAWSNRLALFNYSGLLSVQSNLVAQARARAADSDAMALVTMAELDKTLDMFVGGAKAAASLVTNLARAKPQDVQLLARLPMKLIQLAVKNPVAFRKKFFRGASDSFIALSSMWLGYRYGIMATYYDVESWCTVFSERRSKPRSRYVVAKNSSYDSGNNISLVSDGTFAKTYFKQRYMRFSRTSCGVLCTMMESEDPSYSLGMRSVLSTAWELVPFSFVLDWFIDAGTRIQALESDWIRPVLGSWCTHRSTLTSIRHFYTEPKAPTIIGNERLSWVDGHNEGLLTEETHIVERIANPSLSLLPNIQLRLNFKRVADGVALVRPLLNTMDKILMIR